MNSEIIAYLKWQEEEYNAHHYRTNEIPEDGLILNESVVWHGSKWVRDYDTYPDGGDIGPVTDTHLRFVLDKYGVPDGLVPIESVKFMSPAKLESFAQQIAELGGEERVRRLLAELETLGYTTKEYLGGGGWGVVFKIIRKNDSRAIAMKILKPPYSEEWRKRFLREVNLMRSFIDQSKVASIEAEPIRVCDLMCLPIQLIEGRPLSNLVLPVEPRIAMAIVSEILDGLAIIHSKNIVHRDLHLGNVMLSFDGTLVILDLGLAREEHVPTGSQTFRPVGAMSHCAPEKWVEPSSAGPPSDVFSVGVMFYRLLTGNNPFWEETYIRLYEKMKKGQYPAASTLGPDVPDFIDIVIRAFLMPDPKRRPKSASEALELVGHARALLSLQIEQTG